jgi:hypothetical protein
MRLSAQEILNSSLLPPRIEDQWMKEVMRILGKRETKQYKDLLARLFETVRLGLVLGYMSPPDRQALPLPLVHSGQRLLWTSSMT